MERIFGEPMRGNQVLYPGKSFVTKSCNNWLKMTFSLETNPNVSYFETNSARCCTLLAVFSPCERNLEDCSFDQFRRRIVSLINSISCQECSNSCVYPCARWLGMQKRKGCSAAKIASVQSPEPTFQSASWTSWCDSAIPGSLFKMLITRLPEWSSTSALAGFYVLELLQIDNLSY